MATGDQDGPFSLTLYDNGCGQQQNEFEHTFLNVLTPGEIKQEFAFLQGKYGMGSTGVLPFCGEKGYKFIASAAHDTSGEWAWSIIRKNREKTQYEYLVVNGQPPEFNGEISDRESGTFVKCFEFQSEVKSTITKRFRYRLERYITGSPVPIRLNERRYDGYGAPYTKGLLPSLRDRPDLIQGQERIEHTFDNDVLGTRDVEIFLLKADDQLEELGLTKGVKEAFVRGAKQTKQAILFTYNGQTHGDQGQTFIKRRCNLRRISNDVLIITDFSGIDDADVVDLFKPSRDRLQNKTPAKVLKSELEELISDNEMLREEEERRKSKDIEEDAEELEEDILDEILERNPALKGYLKEGKKTPTIEEEGGEDIDYDGNFYPTKFNTIKKYRSRGSYDVWDGDKEEDDLYEKRIPSNKTSIQRFELDATNDFLTRERETGTIEAQLPSMVKSKSLKDGVLTLRLDPPDAFSSGDTVTLELEVSPVDASIGDLTQTFRIQIIDPVERTKRPTPENDEDNSGAAGFELPDATWVPEEKWDRHGFNQYSIISLEPGPDGDITLFINEDAAPLVNFRKRHNLKESGKKYVRRTYKLGVILYSVGQYMEIERETKEDPNWEEIDPVDVVEATMKGVAQSLLDQTIADEKLREITY